MKLAMALEKARELFSERSHSTEDVEGLANQIAHEVLPKKSLKEHLQRNAIRRDLMKMAKTEEWKK